MVESGSFPNAKSDDPLALTPVAPDAVDDEFGDDANAEVEIHAEPVEPSPAASGGFDRFRAALSAGSWCFDKAGRAASQGASVVAAYPRASLASGLSVLVLGGVLTFSPGKKPPTAQVPNPDAPAASPTKSDAKGESIVDAKPAAPESNAEDPAEKPKAPLLAETEAEPEASKPPAEQAAHTPDPAAEPIPAPGAETHSASLLPLSAGPEPTPPVEPVKLTAGLDDPGLPDLPVVEKDLVEPVSEDARPAPVPAPAIVAGGLGAATGLGAFELTKADVKPGEPAIEDVAAPASTPDPAPAPDPVTTPDPAPVPDPVTTPDPVTLPTPDAVQPGAAPTPTPEAVPEPTPATTPLESTPPTPTLPAEPHLPLAAPAPVAETAAEGTSGAVGLGVGLGAAATGAAGLAIDGLGDKSAEPPPPISPTKLADAKPEKPAVSNESPQIMVPKQSPRPSETPAPTPAPESNPNPIPIQAQPPATSPGSLPPFQEVPEAPLASSAEPPTPPAAQAKVDATPKTAAAAEEHPDWVPIRRSGNLVATDFDRDEPRAADPFTGLEGEPADDASRFDLETYPPRGQAASRDDRGLAASSATATARSAGKIDTVLHKVESGENFYTISQSYYSSGRYYRALAFANADKFKRPEDLFVGAVIRIPPPENLDPSYIDPPGTRYRSKSASASTSSQSQSPKTAAAAPKTSTPIRRARRTEVELNLPISDPAAERASDERGRYASGGDEADFDRDGYEPKAASRSVSTRPVHKVQPDETLRTIARDRLGSGRRAKEILELNRDTIDDPSELVVGQILELPEDARVTRSQGRR